jgi:hypothetical protein
MKRVIRSDKPVSSVFPVKLQKCDFGAEPRGRLIATAAGKGINTSALFFICKLIEAIITVFTLLIRCVVAPDITIEEFCLMQITSIRHRAFDFAIAYSFSCLKNKSKTPPTRFH